MAAGRGGMPHRGSGRDSGCGRRAVSSSGRRRSINSNAHAEVRCCEKEAAACALTAGLYVPNFSSKLGALRMPTRPVPTAEGDVGDSCLVSASAKSSRRSNAPAPWPAQAAISARKNVSKVPAAEGDLGDPSSWEKSSRRSSAPAPWPAQAAMPCRLQEVAPAAAAAEAPGAARRRRSCPGAGGGLSRPGSNIASAHQDHRNGAPTQCEPGLEFFQEGLQGMRSYMEDRILMVPKLPRREDVAVFGVFDGHGGSQVAQLATELLPEILTACLTRYVEPATAIRECFLQLDEEIRRSQAAALHGFDSVGCTANVIVVIRRASRLRLFCANSGDSRAVLSRAGVALELSQDHKPHDPREKRRIEAAGGFVSEYEGRASRVDGTLAVSRALGDFRFKARPDLPPEKQKVIALPDIKEISVGACDEYVAVGSDGVFSVFTSEVLISKLGAARRAGQSWQEAIHEVLEQSAPGQDNASLCVARFVH